MVFGKTAADKLNRQQRIGVISGFEGGDSARQQGVIA
jgi:hypothetical protein